MPPDPLSVTCLCMPSISIISFRSPPPPTMDAVLWSLKITSGMPRIQFQSILVWIVGEGGGSMTPDSPSGEMLTCAFYTSTIFSSFPPNLKSCMKPWFCWTIFINDHWSTIIAKIKSLECFWYTVTVAYASLLNMAKYPMQEAPPTIYMCAVITANVPNLISHHQYSNYTVNEKL